MYDWQNWPGPFVASGKIQDQALASSLQVSWHGSAMKVVSNNIHESPVQQFSLSYLTVTNSKKRKKKKTTVYSSWLSINLFLYFKSVFLK
jgi:hypothetical protein